MSFWMILLKRSSSGSIRLTLLALGPIATVAFYGYIMSWRRNADKSYQFGETVRVKLRNVQGSDAYFESTGHTREEHVEDHEYSKEPRNRLWAR